jgi:4-amino-4-deoxy-L-arabinose transferase-like glycosyltransferase
MAAHHSPRRAGGVLPDSRSVRRPSPFARRLAAIAAGGFVLRAVFALAVAPDSLNHQGDPRFFHLAANLLADGHGYIAPLPFLDNGSVITSTEHPPLWSALLAVFSVVGGRSYEAHELVACAVGAATIACAGVLGRRAGGERAGLIAACATAVYPVFVAMDGSLMSEPPYALAIALSLVLAFRFLDEPTMRRAAALGLAIGLAALVRGEALGLLVVLLVPVVLQLPRKRRLSHAAVIVAVAVLTITPWSIRNSLAMDQPVLVSTEDGPVIAGANCDATYHGRDTGYWRSDCLAPGTDRNQAARSARLRGDGLEYAGDHAGRLVAVEGVRLLRTFGVWQPERHVFFSEGRKLPGRGIAVVAAWLVVAAGLAGAWALRRRAPGKLAILLAPVVLAMGTTLIAFGYPRFRYAADVSLIVLGAMLVDRLVSSPRARRATARPAR